jgi:hypothetical protein
MHQQIQTVLQREEVRQTSKGPVHKFFDQNGTEYSTFVAAIGETTRALVGMPVLLTYDSQPSRDGRFENRYIQEVTLANGAQQPLPQQPMQPQQPMGNAPAGVVMGPPIASFPPFAGVPAAPAAPEMAPAMAEPYVPIEYQRPKHPDEQRAIRRAVAQNNAMVVLPYLENKLSSPAEALLIAELYERWLAGEVTAAELMRNP